MSCVRVFLPVLGKWVIAMDESGLFVVCVTYRVTPYRDAMIKGFRHKGLENFYRQGGWSGVLPNHATRLRAVLQRLDVAKSARDMNAPSLRLHRLKDSRRGTWSVRVSGNWRVTFRFKDTDALDVDYEDYH